MKKNILAKLSPFHFLMLLIAGIINAIGVTLFIAPVQLYDSGISGTSILLSQLTPDYLSLSFFLILLNIPLLLFGFKRQGAVFSIYAIFTVCVYSVAAWLITDVLPIDVSIASPLAGTDLFLCALFGGIISGVGSGLAIRYGGAMDGIEVVAVIFAKPLGLSVGTFVLIYNVLLYIICGIVMGSWILPLYSIVTYAAGSKTVDFIVDGLDSAKAAMIITTHPDEIARAVSEEFGTGLTIIDAHGAVRCGQPLPDRQAQDAGQGGRRKRLYGHQPGGRPAARQQGRRNRLTQAPCIPAMQGAFCDIIRGLPAHSNPKARDEYAPTQIFTACGGCPGGSGPAGGRGNGGPGGGSAGYTLHRRPGGGAGNCLDALPDRKKAAGERGRGQHDA